MYNEIKNNLSTKIDKSLVDDLLEEYKEIKNYQFRGQNENAINKSGKFVETVFQILKYIMSKKVINNPNITDISNELLQTPKNGYPSSIRKIIPRSAKAIYTIRSERGAAHKSEAISPNIIDCEFVVSTCDWILSEFLRLYHNSDVNEITKIVNGLIEKKVPIIEEFGEDICILKEDLSNKDEILLILYHFYPKMVSNAALTKWTKSYTQKTLTNLRNAEKEKLVYRNGKENTLTKRGITEVETIISKRK